MSWRWHARDVDATCKTHNAHHTHKSHELHTRQLSRERQNDERWMEATLRFTRRNPHTFFHATPACGIHKKQTTGTHHVFCELEPGKSVLRLHVVASHKQPSALLRARACAAHSRVRWAEGASQLPSSSETRPIFNKLHRSVHAVGEWPSSELLPRSSMASRSKATKNRTKVSRSGFLRPLVLQPPALQLLCDRLACMHVPKTEHTQKTHN
jgi:hypothetical protein